MTSRMVPGNSTSKMAVTRDSVGSDVPKQLKCVCNTPVHGIYGISTVPALNIVPPQTLCHFQMVLNSVPRHFKSCHNFVNIIPGVHLSGISKGILGTRGYLEAVEMLRG